MVVGRSLRDAHVPISIEDTTIPFRQSEDESSLDSLRMDIVTSRGSLFKNTDGIEDKTLLTDLTLTNPCAPSQLNRCAMQNSQAVQQAAAKRSYCNVIYIPV